MKTQDMKNDEFLRMLKAVTRASWEADDMTEEQAREFYGLIQDLKSSLNFTVLKTEPPRLAKGMFNQ